MEGGLRCEGRPGCEGTRRLLAGCGEVRGGSEKGLAGQVLREEEVLRDKAGRVG